MGNHLNRGTRPLALVVDDDVVIRMDMTDMLTELGFVVEEADCVSGALAFLQQKGDSVTFLLTDVQMPGSRNGVTLANHVSFVWPHIHILVTSGVSRPATGELPVEVEFITKPVTSLALNAYVANFQTDQLPH